MKRPAIRCRHDGTKPPEAFALHPKNWNTHPPEQLRLFAKIIRTNGWRRSVVISRRSGFVVKGNGAVQAALEHGLGPVPFELQDYRNEREELQDLTADNKLAELAQTDEQKLDALLKELTDAGEDPELAGIQKIIDEASVELRPIKAQAPPALGWCLICLPLKDWGRLNPHLEKITALPGIRVETTVSDEPKEPAHVRRQKNGQP